MRWALKLATGCLAVLSVLSSVLAPNAGAQQLPRELQTLQETVRDLYRAGRYREALPPAEQALALVVRDFGLEHEQTGVQTYTLGLISSASGDLGAAERYYAQTLRIREKVYGPDSPAVAMDLEALGQVLVKSSRLDEAEPMFRRALAIRQDLVGRGHAFSATAHSLLGDVSLARGNWAAALSSYRQASKLLVSQDTSHSVVRSLVEDEISQHRDTFVGLCRAAWQTRVDPGTSKAALFEETFTAAQHAWHTAAASALAKMTARLGAAGTDLGRSIRRVQDLSERVLALGAEDQKLLAQWSAVQRADARYSALSEEFRALSISRGRDHAPILKQQQALVEQMTGLLERCPPGQKKAGCETSDRERAAIGKQLAELSKATAVGADQTMALHQRMEAAEKALPGYQAFTERRTKLRDEMDGTEREVGEARKRIAAAFPDYVALSDPAPLTLAQAQGLLKPDEALLAVLVGSVKSFVWALTRERAEWAQIDAGAMALAEQVAALRRGLDPLAQQDAEGTAGSRAGVTGGFDLGKAHALYRLVLAPVAGVLAGKRHVIVVPTGPLTSLPFQVLVTRPPDAAASGREALRGAEWLIKSYALSVLPSAQSLRALRGLARVATAPEPFFGIGDPILQGADPADSQRGKRRADTNPARFYRSGLADISAVRDLSPLPETADELRAVAKALGAQTAVISLRAEASELRVKSTALDQYRVIQFATHGLIAGDLSGLTEPALVLTPPDVPTEVNDGLLTASEIAALKINADWVVLSACNTAAGAGQGADALSGLARAFFYAGARALLVSHWSVYSEAAVALTSQTFATLTDDPKIGRAEAFRRTMLGLIAKGHEPSYWAPFVIVGEAGAR